MNLPSTGDLNRTTNVHICVDSNELSNGPIIQFKKKDIADVTRLPSQATATKPKDEQITFHGGKLGEIYRKIMAAIDEHKSLITDEYRALKRSLDLDRGSKRSELKLARKSKRSKNHLHQLETEEYNMKSDHMHQLHDTLLRHHFSLAKVEDQCLIALKDECLAHVKHVNSTEMSIWKRACQDMHDTLDIPVKAFTLKGKCKQIANIAIELIATVEEAESLMQRVFNASSISVENSDNAVSGNLYRAAAFFMEARDRINYQISNLDRKRLVKVWPTFSEELRELLGNFTHQLKYQESRRLEQINELCACKLSDVQQAAARRHGKLMQKVAREQELLDHDRAEYARGKHGDHKAKKHLHDKTSPGMKSYKTWGKPMEPTCRSGTNCYQVSKPAGFEKFGGLAMDGLAGVSLKNINKSNNNNQQGQKQLWNKNLNADSSSSTSSTSSSGGSISSSDTESINKAIGEKRKSAQENLRTKANEQGDMRKFPPAALLKRPSGRSHSNKYSQEFNSHQRKSYIGFERCCSCCNMDNLVNKFCPCIKSKYEDFKERRALKREKREMQRNVLLRLREDVN